MAMQAAGCSVKDLLATANNITVVCKRLLCHAIRAGMSGEGQQCPESHKPKVSACMCKYCTDSKTHDDTSRIRAKNGFVKRSTLAG
jgi:hypothetical protein